MTRTNRTDNSLLIYVAFFVGLAFVVGIMGLLVVGPANPATAETNVPVTWVLAFVTLLIGPPVGTVIAMVWGAGNGR